ncbi:uncharacterized protein EI90DRAFT_3096038 [Cantharellus anzutake]|uniref:uncharacterized protein n=1 Tax=Cantharellus anzutake TaxID=1750568 RepID=UPI001906CDE3|nr:uncharacterized protein EI90DRAFT_3096038 [Cantharellus anzutake]KAF8311663.1 hypothetical protein EI90DRAFT_3096038 [Cantharellus anzutake]
MGVWSAGAVAIGAAAANLAPLGVLGVFTGMGAYGLVPLTAGAAGAAAGAAAGSAAGAAAAVGALMLVPDLKFSLWFSVKDVNAPPCHQFFSILVEKGGSIANGDVNFLGNSEKSTSIGEHSSTNLIFNSPLKR